MNCSRCPKEISFICDAVELVGKMIDKVLSTLFDGLIEPLIEALFDALGLDDLLAGLPTPAWFDDIRSGVENFGQELHDKLAGYYDDIRTKMTKFLDVR